MKFEVGQYKDSSQQLPNRSVKLIDILVYSNMEIRLGDVEDRLDEIKIMKNQNVVEVNENTNKTYWELRISTIWKENFEQSRKMFENFKEDLNTNFNPYITGLIPVSDVSWQYELSWLLWFPPDQVVKCRLHTFSNNWHPTATDNG